MLQYASVTGFVRTLLIILLVYFGIKILSRLFAPVILKYFSKKVEKKFGQQFGGFQTNEPPEKEGETSIDKMPKTKSSNKDVGEYVDYEEID